MYNALQPLISQLDEGPPRSQLLAQLGTIKMALQAQYPTMLYSDILTHAYERLAQNLKSESTFPSDSLVRYQTLDQSNPKRRNA